jgi:diguanylate cyclase (GGDEF)-like protein
VGSRILLVDDQARDLLSLRHLLSSAGHQVQCASGGKEALARVAEQNFDLVVLDVVMPDMDGAATLLGMRKRASSWLPVMFLSQRCTPEMRADLLKLGADDAVAKPYLPAELLARTNTLLRLKSQQDSLLTEKRKLEQLAITDGLTGLYNFRHFQTRLREELLRSVRYHQPLSLLLIDLDHFKSINDSLGHPAGDQVLKHVATTMAQQVRETDMVARYGGEEFAIILPQTARAGAQHVARRIGLDVGGKPFRVGMQSVKITISIGVGQLDPLHTSVERFISSVDQALYRAKQMGRDQVVVADSAGPLQLSV